MLPQATPGQFFLSEQLQKALKPIFLSDQSIPEFGCLTKVFWHPLSTSPGLKASIGILLVVAVTMFSIS